MSLAVDGLTVARGRRTILPGIAFSAPSGAITGLIGPNGAGKSTLLHAILGLLPATGTARFADQNLPTMPRLERARLAALVEQSATTEERLTVRHVVALGRIPHEPALGTTTDPQSDAIVTAALAETGMSAFAERLFSTLSGGEQQRVHIARALAQQPRVLLLDEPTSHLDIAAQLHLLTLLRRHASAGGTVLVALHDLNLAVRACDHLVVLSNGRVITEGAPCDVLTPGLLRAVYGVRARLLPDPVSGRPAIVYDAPPEANPD